MFKLIREFCMYNIRINIFEQVFLFVTLKSIKECDLMAKQFIFS